VRMVCATSATASLMPVLRGPIRPSAQPPMMAPLEAYSPHGPLADETFARHRCIQKMMAFQVIIEMNEL